MKIFFISRAFPPVTGGIENQNYALSVWLARVATTTTLANPYGKKFLPFFLPYATLRTLFTLRQYDVILLGDGVLSVIGFIVKFFFPRKTVVSVVHGLDLTYPSPVYQKYWVGKFLPSLDGLIAVSQETKKRAIEKGIAANKVAIIANGIETKTLIGNFSRSDLETLLEIDIKERKILLTAGRLVKRKGVEWFILFVLPRLPKETLYLVAGSGPEEQAIRRAIADTHTESQVKLLGRVSDEILKLLLNTVDIFVQPNIQVAGDMEGFGIAVIEAAGSGRPVVAANLEGLKDAIINNENGILVESANLEAFEKTIRHLLTNEEVRRALGERAQSYTREHYHWQIISKQYLQVLQTYMKK